MNSSKRGAVYGFKLQSLDMVCSVCHLLYCQFVRSFNDVWYFVTVSCKCINWWLVTEFVGIFLFKYISSSSCRSRNEYY